MIDRIKEYLEQVNAFKSNDAQVIEDFRVSYAGKKGILNSLFASFREVPADEKKAFGQELNILKAAVADKVKELQSQQLSNNSGSARISDPTRTPFPIQTGNRHPLSVVKNRIIDIFTQIGFTISEGPEIEDDWHNFTALNLPEYHPARDMQDTFLFRPIQISYYALTLHLFRFGIWKKINLLFVPFRLDEYFVMKQFLPEHIVFFIKWRAYTLLKMSLLQT